MALSGMSIDSLFSAHWHHVQNVCVRLAEDVSITRHVYRKRVSWVLNRRATSTYHRLDKASFELIDRLDGSMTVGEVWVEALKQRDHGAPTQDEWMRLLAELHAADLLVVEGRLPVEQLFERRRQHRESDRHKRYFNPLYLRFALFDPDKWLERLLPLANSLFSRGALLIWVALLVTSCLVVFSNIERLVLDMADVASLDPHMALLFIMTYPPLKFLHELGHALAVKRCGGRVNETGIALLVMLPLPYVDASASSLFKSRNDRMLVSSAGILVELGIAFIGVLLWAGSTGFVSDLGLVLLLTGGLSTLLINGNPLLKFDGYYLLADWLEIPNLQSRSRQAVIGDFRRWLAGDKEMPARHLDSRERCWLVSYGICASIYRPILMLSIAWVVSERWYLAGVGLALYVVVSSLIIPVCKGFLHLFKDADLRVARARLLALGVPICIVALLCLLPLPHASVTQGVVWLPDNALIRAAGDCQITEVFVSPGSQVQSGDELFHCEDIELQAREQLVLAQLSELKARLYAHARTDQVEYSRLANELESVNALLEDIQQRAIAQKYTALVEGRFDVHGVSVLLGRVLAQGDIAGYTIPDTGRTIRLAFAEHNFADIDGQIERVEIRVNGRGNSASNHRTSILHRAPSTTRSVPSAALSSVGGGVHAADPLSDGLQLLEPVVDLELAWPAQVTPAPVGEHVSVRLVHTPAPLAERLLKSVQRAFMDRQPV